MAVKIRLTRTGKKKQPSYRVVVADARSPRDGRYIEQIGRYHPLSDPSEVVIDNERAAYWLSVGAQPTEAVAKLLQISGAMEAAAVKPRPTDPKVHVVGEEAQLEAAADDAELMAAAEAEADEVEVEVEDPSEVETPAEDAEAAPADEEKDES